MSCKFSELDYPPAAFNITSLLASFGKEVQSTTPIIPPCSHQQSLASCCWPLRSWRSPAQTSAIPRILPGRTIRYAARKVVSHRPHRFEHSYPPTALKQVVVTCVLTILISSVSAVRVPPISATSTTTMYEQWASHETETQGSFSTISCAISKEEIAGSSTATSRLDILQVTLRH